MLSNIGPHSLEIIIFSINTTTQKLFCADISDTWFPLTKYLWRLISMIIHFPKLIHAPHFHVAVMAHADCLLLFWAILFRLSYSFYAMVYHRRYFRRHGVFPLSGRHFDSKAIFLLSGTVMQTIFTSVLYEECIKHEYGIQIVKIVAMWSSLFDYVMGVLLYRFW